MGSPVSTVCPSPLCTRAWVHDSPTVHDGSGTPGRCIRGSLYTVWSASCHSCRMSLGSSWRSPTDTHTIPGSDGSDHQPYGRTVHAHGCVPRAAACVCRASAIWDLRSYVPSRPGIPSSRTLSVSIGYPSKWSCGVPEADAACNYRNILVRPPCVRFRTTGVTRCTEP